MPSPSPIANGAAADGAIEEWDVVSPYHLEKSLLTVELVEGRRERGGPIKPSISPWKGGRAGASHRPFLIADCSFTKVQIEATVVSCGTVEVEARLLIARNFDRKSSRAKRFVMPRFDTTYIRHMTICSTFRGRRVKAIVARVQRHGARNALGDNA